MRGQRCRIAGALAVTGMIAAGGSAIAAAAPASAAPRVAPAAAKPAAPDVTVLFGRALARTHATRTPRFARARIYEADGATARGTSTRSASGITRWRFVFDNFPSHSRFASATLTWSRTRGFGDVNGIKSPFLEDMVIPKPPKMTLAAAVARLRGAGVRTPFVSVTLRRPVGPTKVHTLYLFGLSSGRYVSVDTVTGKVRRVAG
jgi:hypothetical protein